MAALARGDLAEARAEQFRSVQLVNILARRGFMGSAKAMMKHLGIEVGPARLPNVSLGRDESVALAAELKSAGVFDWIEDRATG